MHASFRAQTRPEIRHSNLDDWKLGGKDSTSRGNTCDPSHSRAGNGCPAKCHHRRAESTQLQRCEEDSHLVAYVYRDSPCLSSTSSFSYHRRYIYVSISPPIASHWSIIDLFATDRLPTVSASDAFRNLSDDDHQSPSNAYTDISELDHAIGGGFECGRVTELWGPPGAGKTAIAYVNALEKSYVFALTSSQPESRCVYSAEGCSCCLDRYVPENSPSPVYSSC
jgi:hypothetical protein